MRLLLERGVSPRQIVATTFTRAASTELFERVSASIDDLRTLIRRFSDAPTANDIEALEEPAQSIIKGFVSRGELNLLNLRLERASREISQIRIGTLDGICQQWIREFALEAGLSAELELSQQSPRLLSLIAHSELRSFRSWLADSAPQVFEVMVSSGRLIKLSDLSRSLSGLGNALSVPVRQAPGADLPQIKADLSEYFELLSTSSGCLVALESWLASNTASLLKPATTAAARLQRIFGAANQALINNAAINQTLAIDMLGVFSDWYGFIDTEAHLQQKLLKGKLKKTPEVFSNLPFYNQFLSLCRLARHVNQGLDALDNQLTTQIALRAQSQLDQKLSDQGLTSFSGEVRRLAQALSGQNGPKLAAAIRQSYPVILIDECQDINLDQGVLIDKIIPASLSEEAQKRVFLLLVGDPKQAIYAFRGADVRNYLRLKAKFAAPSELLMNFRSSSKLIEELNQFFALSPEISPGIEYTPVAAKRQKSAFACLESGAPLNWLMPADAVSDAELPAVASLDQAEALDGDVRGASEISGARNGARNGGVDTPGHSKRSALPAADTPTEAIAAEIASLLKNPEITPQDICVLTTRNSDIFGLIRACARRGVPASGNARQNLFSLKSAELLQLVLSALAEPRKTAWLRSVLVSELFGDSLSELVEAEYSGRLDQLQSITAEAHELWQQKGLWQAWQYWVEQTRLYDELLKQKGGSTRLRELTELLRAMITQVSGGTPFDQLKALSAWLAEPPEEEWALTSPSGSGVHIMTIHRSKGLEFPVVFVMGLDSAPRNTKRVLHAVVELGGEMQQKLLAHPSSLEVEEQARQQMDEKRRLLYVAMTRASERVYLVSKSELAKVSEKSPLGPWRGADLPTVYPDSAAFYAQSDAPDIPEPQALPKGLSFYAPGQTSFSRLARSIDTAGLEQAAIDNAEQGLGTEELSKMSPQQSRIDPQGSAQLADLYPPLGDTQDSAFADLGVLKRDELEGDLEYEKLEVDTGAALTHQSSDTEAGVSKQQPDQISDLEAAVFGFERGAVAGSCLHRILEEAVPKGAVSTSSVQFWLGQFGITRPLAKPTKTFDAALFGLSDEERLAALSDWLGGCLEAALPEGAALGDLAGRVLPEMSFAMSARAAGLSQLTHALNQALKRQLPKAVAYAAVSVDFSLLVGEIDAVYEHEGRYWVVDYKSNFLGDSTQDYDPAAMIQAMNHHSYWLQAAIYAAALHRYLRTRIPNYDPEQHFGGVVYAFLRGMRAGQTSGVLSLNFTASELDQFDRLLGGGL
jgi:exodeoxyribonuclease V beta subunit